MGNYSLAVRMYPEVMRSVGFSSISGTYIGIGTALDNPSLQLIIQNLTDQSVVISWDGINDHLVLVSGCAWDSDNTSNRAREQGLYIPQGQRFYARQLEDTSPTSGAVYLTTFYGQGV
jgi:hypothetical protein